MIGWARALRDQCATTGVPFFWKQWGETCRTNLRAEHTAMRRVGKKLAGAFLTASSTRHSRWRCQRDPGNEFYIIPLRKRGLVLLPKGGSLKEYMAYESKEES